jgi:hypothetical protein
LQHALRVCFELLAALLAQAVIELHGQACTKTYLIIVSQLSCLSNLNVYEMMDFVIVFTKHPSIMKPFIVQ